MIDNDVGYMFVMAEQLARIDIAVIPATSAPEAESLLSELGVDVELALVNLEVRDAGLIIQQARKRNPNLIVVALDGANRWASYLRAS